MRRDQSTPHSSSRTGRTVIRSATFLTGPVCWLRQRPAPWSALESQLNCQIRSPRRRILDDAARAAVQQADALARTSQVADPWSFQRMKLVILDRDDTLILLPAGRRYLYGEDEIVLAEDAVPFLRRLCAAGVAVAIATNQQGVALPEYPDMTMESVERFHRRLLDELRRQRAPVERIYVCPHAASWMCACRKPRPGLFLQAMQEFCVAPEDTAAIGDQWRDVEAAHASGIRALFLLRPEDAQTPAPAGLTGVRSIASFRECLDVVLGSQNSLETHPRRQKGLTGAG
jgi:D-glycero-D-manno-heptose 1,7-bisphosphate phosphatase